MRNYIKKGNYPWSAGLTKETDSRVAHISELAKKRSSWNKGRTKNDDERILRYANSMRGHQRTVGEKHPNWKGGITPQMHKLRQAEEYKSWRDTIFERDEWTCQECGLKGKRINAHHLKSFTNFPELRFDTNNGVTLCRSCHSKTHDNQNRALNGRYCPQIATRNICDVLPVLAEGAEA